MQGAKGSLLATKWDKNGVFRVEGVEVQKVLFLGPKGPLLGGSAPPQVRSWLFCRSQLLNLAHTPRVTGVKLIVECLWSAESFVLFKIFLIVCC